MQVCFCNPALYFKYPATRNRTRDHLIAAGVYNQMLYQLSYSRCCLACRHSVFVQLVVLSAQHWHMAWTHWGLNPGPSECGADVVPLQHVPVLAAPAAMPTPTTAQLVKHLTAEPCSNQMVPGSIPGGRISCANAHPMPASSLQRIGDTFRHRDSNPGRSGEGRVS